MAQQTEKDTTIKDHPWTICPGPECPFHIWPVDPPRVTPTVEQAHRCQATGCDGTRLGHDLAIDFPEETARFDAAMDRLRGPREDRVMPENLRVIPTAKDGGE